mgnify:CR=1 FL=1
MQQLLIAGTIGRDAVVRHTQGGKAVAGFSVAVDNGKDQSGNKRDATWFDCSLWDKRGEGLAPYLTKGTRVAVTGRPTAHESQGKVYLGVSVDQITLLGGGQDRQQEPQRSDGYGAGSGAGIEDDPEIPF